MKNNPIRDKSIAVPLDQAVWLTWLAKGRAQDEVRARRMKFALVATLLLFLMLWLWFKI